MPWTIWRWKSTKATSDQPDRVEPRTADGARVAGGVLHATLPPRSWNVLRLGRAA